MELLNHEIKIAFGNQAIHLYIDFGYDFLLNFSLLMVSNGFHFSTSLNSTVPVWNRSSNYIPLVIRELT